MHSYKSLLPQPCSAGTHRQREELDSNVQLQVRADCLSYKSCSAVGTHRQREELDRNVQLQVLQLQLIASALQSVLKD